MIATTKREETIVSSRSDAQDEGEDGESEDGAPAAEEPECDTDKGRESHREDDGGVHSSSSAAQAAVGRDGVAASQAL